MHLLPALLLPLFVAVAQGAPVETELKPPAVAPVVVETAPVQQSNLVKSPNVVEKVAPEVEPVVPVEEQKSEVTQIVEEPVVSEKEEERSSRQSYFRDYDESGSSEAEYDDEKESEEDANVSRDGGTDWKAKWGSSITKANIKPIPNFQNVEDDEAEDLGLYGFNKSYEPESFERVNDSASEESVEAEEEGEDEETADEAGSGSASASSSSESVEERDDIPGPFTDSSVSTEVQDEAAAEVDETNEVVPPAPEVVEPAAEEAMAVAVVQKEEVNVPPVVPIVVEDDGNGNTVAEEAVANEVAQAVEAAVEEGIPGKPKMADEEETEDEEEADDDDDDDEDDEGSYEEDEEEDDEEVDEDSDEEEDDEEYDDDDEDDDDDEEEDEDDRGRADAVVGIEKRVLKDSPDVLYYYPYSPKP